MIISDPNMTLYDVKSLILEYFLFFYGKITNFQNSEVNFFKILNKEKEVDKAKILKLSKKTPGSLTSSPKIISKVTNIQSNGTAPDFKTQEKNK